MAHGFGAGALTVWLSATPTVGLASRPICSRSIPFQTDSQTLYPQTDLAIFTYKASHYQ